MSTATLTAHTPGSRLVTHEELAVLPAPVALGPRHRPIPHYDVVHALHTEADRRSLKITREEWALASNDARLFGIVEFDIRRGAHTSAAEHGWSFGIRNSHNQSLALKGVAGTRTFVCDNLSLSGESFVLASKNTLGVNLDSLIYKAYEKYLRAQEKVDDRWETLAGLPVSDTEAKALILDAFVQHKVASIKYLPAVVNEYLYQGTDRGVAEYHADTFPRTKASVLGSFTRTFKDIKSDIVRWDASQKVGKVFGV